VKDRLIFPARLPNGNGRARIRSRTRGDGYGLWQALVVGRRVALP
jgi:hypothetical protein